MRVLIVHDYGVLAGGAERISVDLRDGLRARGHEARLFASTASDFPLPNEADDVCFGSNGWPRPFLQVYNPAATRKLRRLLSDFRPDVVHVRMFLTQLSPAILPLLKPFSAVLHVGNHQTVCPLNTRLLPDGSVCTYRAGIACRRQGCVSTAGLARTMVQLGALRRRIGVFRRIVANSNALARTLRENGVEANTVIPNGTREIASRPPLRHPPTVIYAGRLMPLKGVDVLLQAMALLLPRQPDARLIIAGEGPDRTRLTTLIASLGLQGCVTMEGHLAKPALDERLEGGWVHCVPSRYLEPFANVVVEAMMRGTAVVASNTGGMSEIVRDGVTGFLVPPADPRALADRLLLLLSDRERAEQMGAAGRTTALAEFTTDLMVDRFSALYSALVQ